MNVHRISEIQKELKHLDKEKILEYCLRLAKYKKENKELLSYLLFEAADEAAFVQDVKKETEALFSEINTTSPYYIRKSLRKILRYINRCIKYSGLKTTEIEIRVYYCKMVKESRFPIATTPSLVRIYDKEVEKIKKAFSQLHEDLQFDYKDELQKL